MRRGALEPGRGFAPLSVARIAASALLLLYLWSVWGSGFDRVSLFSPALERLVPKPLRAQADHSAAAVAMARGDRPAALALAVEGLLHDPIDPLSNSLLGSAREYQGDRQGADAAFRVAAERGWRDQLTQLYWYGVALQAGDAGRAALRADALLRVDPDFAAAGELLKPLEASPAGRAALAGRLAENPDWAPAYFSTSGDAKQDSVKSEIALIAARQGVALDCKTQRSLVGALLKRGLRREAERLWRAACGTKGLDQVGEGGLVDGSFRQLGSDDDMQPPFGWRAHASGDVVIEPPTESGSGLTLRNSAAVSRLVLSQAVALAPGRYRIHANAGAAAGRIAFSLDCRTSLQRPTNLEGDAAVGGQVLEIGTCNEQLLGLWLRPASGGLTISGVTIEKLR